MTEANFMMAGRKECKGRKRENKRKEGMYNGVYITKERRNQNEADDEESERKKRSIFTACSEGLYKLITFG